MMKDRMVIVLASLFAALLNTLLFAILISSYIYFLIGCFLVSFFGVFFALGLGAISKKADEAAKEIFRRDN